MRRVAVVAVATIAVAAASLLLQDVPGFDPQGWLLWGREIRDGGLQALDTLAYPSWKPLPALITTPLAFAGGAAPALWLVVMARRGFPAIDRFMMPPAALLCVAGAIGLAQLIALTRQWSGWPQVAVAAAAAVVLLTLVPAPQRVVQQVRAEHAYVRGASGLDAALARAGGPQRVRAVGWSTTQHAFQTRLAWRLGLSSSAVRRRVRGPGLAFAPSARSSAVLRGAATPRRVGAADGWTVWRVAAANGRT